jgi:hypothetical protein
LPSIFDARTLAPKGAVALGLSPNGLAIDARAGHAFVTDATVNPDGSVTGVAAPEGAGERTQLRLRQTMSCLPLPVPPPPRSPCQGTATVLNATQL